MDNMREILKQSAPGARGKEELDGIKQWALTVHGDILKLLKEDQLDQFAQWASFASCQRRSCFFFKDRWGRRIGFVYKVLHKYVEDDGMEEQRKLSMLRSPDKGKEFIEGMCEESFDILGRSVFTVVEERALEKSLFSENSSARRQQ